MTDSHAQGQKSEAVAWQCTDERHEFRYIKGVVTVNKDTLEAWQEGGIAFVALGPIGSVVTPAERASAKQPPVEDLVEAIALAAGDLSEHIEKYHDYEFEPGAEPPERGSLRGIQHHLEGSLIDDRGNPVRCSPAGTADLEEIAEIVQSERASGSGHYDTAQKLLEYFDRCRSQPESTEILSARDIVREIGWTETIAKVGMVSAILSKFNVVRK